MLNATKNLSFLLFKNRLIITLTATATLVIGATTFYSLSIVRTTQQNSSPARPVNTTTPTITEVAALGYLEPQGEVTYVSASTPLSSEGGGSRIYQLLVKEGDKVRTGQVIAILDNYNSRQAALKQAEEQVSVAQARLAQVKAGAKTGEIKAQKATSARLEAELNGSVAAQKATIARLEAEFSNAQAEYQRWQQLYQDGATSASNADSKRLRLETVREQINEAKATLKRTVNSSLDQITEAKATLDRIAEVRPVDVYVARTEVASAVAAVTKAQADLDLSQVRAPKNGQILKIYTWPGEVINNKGIVSLGQTDQMYAVAEVYEVDISRVHIGQRATVTSKNGAFTKKLHGTVTQIGRQIGKKDVLSTDPAADVDARVVDVKIHLDQADSNYVKNLTNLQVQIIINT
jgi:HlyD family secretion protein